MLKFFSCVNPGGDKKNKSQNRSVCERRLVLEPLESREMLSVSPLMPDYEPPDTQLVAPAALNSEIPEGYTYDEGIFLINVCNEAVLRRVIEQAEPDAVIKFAPSPGNETIHLSNTLSIDKAITIDAGGMNITITANGKQVFNIAAGADVTLIGLTITGGDYGVSGKNACGIENFGTLTLDHCVITGNSTLNHGAGSCVVYNKSGATLTVLDSVFTENFVQDSNKVAVIYNEGTLNLYNANFTDNNGEDYYNDKGTVNHLPARPMARLAKPTLHVEDGTITSNSVTLSWKAVPGATGYVVDMWRDDGLPPGADEGHHEFSENEDGSIYYVTVSGLLPYMSYSFRVQATADGVYNPSSWSDVVSVTTLTEKLAAPTLLTVTADGTDAIDVTWAVVNNAQYYIVEYSTDRNFTDSVKAGLGKDITGTSATLTALKANTRYYVRVTAHSDNEVYDDSDPSRVKSAVTDPQVPIAPENFKAVPKTYDPDAKTWTVTLSWTFQDNLTGYTLEYRTSGSDEWLPWSEPAGTATSDTISGLAPLTTYEFRLTAINAGGSASAETDVKIKETPSVVVTTLDDTVADDGCTSLREAIENAGKYGLGMTVTFAESLYGKTIELNGKAISISKGVTIDALDTGITIDAGGKSGVFSTTSSENVTLIGLTITGGKAESGGGIYNNGKLTVINCLIAENESNGNGNSRGGGGIYNANDKDCTVTVINCTITGNKATGNQENGAGIYNFQHGSIILYNTIVALNEGDDISQHTQGTISGSHNLIGADPMFVGNGDYRLAKGSPAIDAGGNAYLPAWLVKDLAGNVRVFNGIVDIGAYEYVVKEKTQLPAPTLGFENVTPDSAVLSWNEIEGAAGYLIKTSTDGGTTWTYVVTIPAGTLTATVDLTRYTENRFKIKALAGESDVYDDSEFSNTVRIKYNEHDVAQFRKAEFIGLNEGQATWEYIAAENEIRLVEVDASGSSLSGELDLSGCAALRELDCSYNELTSLDVSGCAVLKYLDCSNNQLRFSTLILTDTDIDDFLVNPQAEMEIAWLTPWTVDLSGEYMAGTTVYKWYANGTTLLVEGEGNDYTNVGGVFTFFGGKHLMNGALISCVMTNTNFGNMELTTTELEFPGDGVIVRQKAPWHLKSTGKTHNSVTLTWKEVPGATGYEVRFKTADEQWGEPISLNPGEAVTGLDSGTTYVFQVRAVNADGHSRWSKPISVTTNVKYNEHDLEKVHDAKENNGLKWKHTVWTKIDGEMRLTAIYADAADLTGALDFSGCGKLEVLACANNELTSLNVSGCASLFILDCSENLLAELNVSGCTALLRIDCSNNHLTFSTLPPKDGASYANSYAYFRQAEVFIEAKNRTVDLSSEYNIDGTLTTYTWYYADGGEVGENFYDEAGGVFTFRFAEDTEVYCVMTNAKFPKLILTTTKVTITGEDDDDDDDDDDSEVLPPENLAAEATTATSVTLTWDAPEGGATSYRLEYLVDGTWTLIDDEITGTTYTHHGLDPNTTYYYRVFAVNSEGRLSAPSETADAMTLLATPVLCIDGRTPDSITLTWDAVPGATGYEVRYRTGNGGWLTANVTVTGTTAVISGLASDTLYEFQIRAVSTANGNDSEWSNSVSERTLAAPPIAPTLDITWKVPQSKGYTLANHEWRYHIAETSGHTRLEVRQREVTQLEGKGNPYKRRDYSLPPTEIRDVEKEKRVGYQPPSPEDYPEDENDEGLSVLDNSQK